MNKYETLRKKLTAIIEHIDSGGVTTIKHERVRVYLFETYRKYLVELVEAIDNRTILDSNGGVLGLIRGISDRDELCADRKLRELLCDAEDYYRYDCYKF